MAQKTSTHIAAVRRSAAAIIAVADVTDRTSTTGESSQIYATARDGPLSGPSRARVVLYKGPSKRVIFEAQ